MFLIGTFCYETTHASGYHHAWPKGWSTVPYLFWTKACAPFKGGGEGLSAPPWWQLENRVWLSVPDGGLGLCHLHILSGLDRTFHRCPEPANQSHFLHAERAQAVEPRYAELTVPAAGQPSLGSGLLLHLSLSHLYLEQSLDRQMPQEEQVLREKLARLSLSQCPHLLPFLLIPWPLQWPALSSLQVSSSLEGHWHGSQRSWAQAHSRVSWWGGEGRGTWVAQESGSGQRSAGSHGAGLHCLRQVS